MGFISKTKRYALASMIALGLTIAYTKTALAFPVRIATPLFKIEGGPGMRFHEPTDIVVGKNGMIYVLDGVYDRVQVFDSSGKFLFKFGKPGNGDGEFNRPVGIGADRKGYIFVADSQNHRIQIFDSEGKYVNKIILKEFNKGVQSDPTDVLVVSPPDEDEKIWVADNDNHYILIYDRATLKFEKRIGQYGFDEEGKFRYPHNMAVDSKYNVFVVDVLNTRVQEFSRSGEFMREVGEWGIREGTFFRPKGVAVDSGDRVYISDGYMGVVQVFTNDGQYLAVIGSERDKEIKFDVPISLYIDGKNRLYVVQALGHVVNVYKLP